MNINWKKVLDTAVLVIKAIGIIIKHFAIWFGKVFGTLLLIGGVAGIIMGFLFMGYVNKYIMPEASIDLGNFDVDLTSTIYATDPDTGNDVVLTTLHGSQNRVWADYDEIPLDMVNATIAIEDERFRTHSGVDWKRTLGAFTNMFLGSRSKFGGSTITQQLIKNLTGDDEVTVKRKILEIFRALEFEKKYKKDQIMEWYLNTSYFGQGCNGVKTAALEYFGKDVSKLTLAECASIVGITNAPTKYNPYLNPEYNKERQELILSQMLKLGMITQEEYETAVAQKLVFVKSVVEETDEEVQSYFVDQVIDDVIDDLAEQKGVSATVAEMMLYNGGYNVYTTVDLSLQNIMEQAFLDEENFPDIVSSTGEKLQAAMTIVDPYTGNVLAMVGGRGEKTVNRAFNRAASALRQPGSSIKPISVYSPALELGLITPYSVIDDTPMFVRDGKAYPKNYDYVYRGRITVMRAVELSVNAVAYRVVDMVTPEYAFQFAKVNMGLNTLVDSRTLSDGRVVSDIGYAPMSLGGLTDGVTTEEMAASYATFVNNGVYTAPRTYTLVTDADGNTVIDNQPESHVAISEATAYYMNTMLKSVVARGTGTRAKLPNVTVAGKTGTTDNDFDRWFAGYSAYYTGVVWVGYDTPDEIKYSGVNPALNLWQVVMEQVHEGLEDRAFSEPDNLVTANYCLDSGDAPSAYCALDPRGSRIATGVFVSGDEPKKTCAVHVMTDICTETGKLATPYCPETKRMALLDIHRFFGVGGVVVQDEGYTLRTYNAVQSVPEGMYAAVAPSGSINEFCDVHTEEWAAEQEPETSPEVSPSPGDPGASPDVSPSPGESPGGSPSPSASPSMFPSAPVFPSPSPGFGN